MDRLLVLVVVAAAAATLAYLVQRRRPDAPIRTGWTVPEQLDLLSFARPYSPFLFSFFPSASFYSCASFFSLAEPLASASLAVDGGSFDERREVHDHYAVDAVPMVLLVDTLGVVRDHHLGPVSATHLWGSLAELREPGSTPDGCHAGH